MPPIPKPSVLGDAEPDTGRHRLESETTPIGLPNEEGDEQDGDKQAADRRLSSRVKETRAGVSMLQVAVGQTQKDVAKLELGLASVHAKVDVLHERFAEVGGDVREMKGALGVIVKAVDGQQERNNVFYGAHIDIDKHAKIAGIDDAKAAKAFRRDTVLKVIGGVVAVLTSGAFVGYLVHGC